MEILKTNFYKNKVATFFLLTAFLFLPKIVFAQNGLNGLIVSIAQLVQFKIIPTLIGIALLVFLWGVLKYALSQDETKRKESIGVITMGLIILFVIVSVWGLVYLLADFFAIDINAGGTTLPNKPIRTNDVIIR